MKMRMLVACLAAASMCVPAAAQTEPTPVPANAMIPRRARTAPMSAWTPAAGRALITANVDGAVLRGFAFRGTDPGLKLTVLMFNGNGRALNGAGFPPTLAHLGPDVDTYDYRGFGWSTGTPDMFALRQDALALFDTTAAGAGGPSHVVVLGYSFGTVIAAYVASERPVRGLVLISSISTIRQQLILASAINGRMTPEEAANLQYSEGAQTIYDVTKMVARSTAPLLMIHGEADRNVPVAEGREVFAAAAGTPKRLVTIPGVDHNAPGSPDATAAIKTFLNSLR